MVLTAFAVPAVDVNATVPVGSLVISESHNAAVSVAVPYPDVTRHENDTFVT